MGNWKTKVAKATASQGGGPYIQAGNSALRLDVLKEIESSDGKDFVVAEFIVEETDSEHPDMKVGNRVSRLWNMSDHKSAPGNFKAFLCAAYGDVDDEGDYTAFDEDELTGELIDAAVSSDNPLNGALFIAAAHTTITKVNKKEFTKIRWALGEPAPVE